MSSPKEPLLLARGLVKSFPWRAPFRATRRLVAVDGIDVEVGPGECLGVVGESGSGKTTLGRVLARLLPPDSGTIRFAGTDLLAARGAELRSLRRRLQMVFQDSAAAFDPRWRVGDILAEPLRLHRLAAPGAEEDARVRSLLADVGLGASVLSRYPHQLSGGQRQRLAIARALALKPELLVLDEPVASLDVSVQAQILHLLHELRRRFALAMVFISHDLTVVEQIAERVAVLYLGRVVEVGPSQDILRRPLHPYTACLLASMPVADPRFRRPAALQGEIPSPLDPPPGCRFHPRCPIARDRCRSEEPEGVGSLRPSGAACHFPGEMQVPEVAAEDGRTEQKE